MEKLIWDDQFSVGIDELDMQHKKLIELINALIDLNETEKNPEVLDEVLTQITKYACTHFSTEEKYMLESRYPGYEEHKAQHDVFRKKNGQFHLDAELDKNVILQSILLYLKEWLMSHIIQTDQQYKGQLTKPARV